MTKPSKLLLVDDERRFIAPLLERLTYEGIDYDFCATASEALSNLKTGDYDLIIIDLLLPLGEGTVELFVIRRKK